MTEKRSAYEITFAKVNLTVEEQCQALRWWQSGVDYYPLCCPVCGATLTVAAVVPELRCPTSWCHYVNRDIPWGIYAAWRKATGDADGSNNVKS